MSDRNQVDPDEPAVPEVQWDIRRHGRTWDKGEALTRYELTPTKIELADGKLCRSELDRVMLLGLLLENLGADRAVRLGNPEVWRAAVKGLR